MGIPSTCPRCREVLYPIAALRPQPKSHLLAKLLLALGGLVAGAILWVGWYLIRVQWEVRVPTRTLAGILMVPAIVVGFVIAWLGSHLPRQLKLRCSKCGWNEQFRVPEAVDPHAGPRLPAAPNQPSIGAPRELPMPPVQKSRDPLETVSQESPFDRIVDDGAQLAEIKAWIYAEFLEGRSAEGISAALVSNGWTAETAEPLVEEARRLTRHRRGVVTRDDVVQKMNQRRMEDDQSPL